MRHRIFVVAVAVALAMSANSALADAFFIRHQPINFWTDGIPLRIAASTPAKNQTESLVLYYRRIGSSDFVRLEMHSNDDQNYVGEIPESERSGDGIEYFIEGNSRTGEHKTVPDFLASISPIQVKLRQDLKSDRASLVWPDFSQPLDLAQPLFEFEFNENGNTISPDHVDIELDGKSIVALANITGFGATVKCPTVLAPGMHTIKLIEVFGSSKTVLVSKEFSYGEFKAVSSSQIHGRVEGQVSRVGSTQASTTYLQPSDDQLNLNVYGAQSGVNFNGNVMISSRELADYQPVNRYMFSLSNFDRSIQVEFGDTNPNFSELTVSGIQSRGMNVMYDSDWGSINFNFGDTFRAVEGSTTANIAGTFQQNMAAFQSTLKLGDWGTLSPTIAKISDNEASILDPGGSQPHENYLSSIKSTVWLEDKQIEINSEVAASLYYRDKTAEETEVPGIPSIVKSTFPIKAGMTFDTAMKFSIDAPLGPSMVSAYFSKTGSGYQSLGNTGLRSDRQEYYLSDKVFLFSKYAYVSGSYKNSHDNLLNIAALTNYTRSYKASAAINFPGLPNLSAGVGIDDNLNNATEDSQKVNNRIVSFSGALSNFGVSLWSFSNQLSLNGTYTLFSDLAPAGLLSPYNQKSISANWRNQVISEVVTLITGGVNVKSEPTKSQVTTYYNAGADITTTIKQYSSVLLTRISITKGSDNKSTLKVMKFQPELALTWNKDDATQFIFRGRYLDFIDQLEGVNSYVEKSLTADVRISF